MTILKLKKKSFFSLIIILLCSVYFLLSINFFEVSDYITDKYEYIKQRQMKYIFNQSNNLGDNIVESTGNNIDNSSLNGDRVSQGQNIAYPNKVEKNMLVEWDASGNNTFYIDALQEMDKYNSIFKELETQINADSYRDKRFGPYYVFSFDYTMNALKELNNSLDRISTAQKVPKELIAAVLFREMMFLGQEDLLDGVPIIGGKSIGICQIGIENVKLNEQIVHGESSVLLSETDDKLRDMLQNPKYAVYFCAVQLRARAITLTGNQDIDLRELDENQLKQVLENYNQSKISFNIGPVKTKERYAMETYKYCQLFKDYYSIVD